MTIDISNLTNSAKAILQIIWSLSDATALLLSVSKAPLTESTINDSLATKSASNGLAGTFTLFNV